VQFCAPPLWCSTCETNPISETVGFAGHRLEWRRGSVPATGVYPGRHTHDKYNNPQQSWGFGGEPPEAVMKDSGTRDGTL
jgi:hypothetical protein